jgi:plastocyanin
MRRPRRRLGGSRPGPGAATFSAVVIRNFAFHQQTVTVTPGTTVTWTNQDSSAHTVTADDHSVASSPLAQGQSFRRTFPGAGTHGYHCEIHQCMTGTVMGTG